MRSRPELLLLLALAMASQAASAAVVERVHKDRDKILLILSRDELATIELDQEVVIEVAKPHFVAHGTVTKINPLKKTAVIEFDDPDTRFARKQQVRFLSAFWNVETSPEMTNYAQYHQYTRSDVEGAFGAFYEGTSEKAGSVKGTSGGFGTRFQVQGYALISPTLLGAGLGFERRDVTFNDSTAPQPSPHVSLSITDNILRPGAWVQVDSHWRIGARYDYTLLDYEFHNTGATYSYQFAQPVLTVLQYDADGEIGLTYIGKDKFTATGTQLVGNGVVENTSSTMKMPAELDLSYRSISSPVFIWGLGAGYIFYERQLDPTLPLRPKAYPEQMTRLRLSFEDRLDDGDKLEWLITYDGAQALGLSSEPQRANMGGLSLTYQTTIFDMLVVGGTGTLAAGAAQQSEGQIDPTTGQLVNVTRNITGYRAGLMLFARYELDLIKKGRHR